MKRWSYLTLAFGLALAGGCGGNGKAPTPDTRVADDSGSDATVDTSIPEASEDTASLVPDAVAKETMSETADAGDARDTGDAGDANESAPPFDAGPCLLDLASPLPCDLKDAGLYSVFPTSSDLASGTIDPKNVFMAPAYALWSDGAEKRRWIYLPPGKQIDVTDMNEWVFPVGTKFFKEFDVLVNGVRTRVETRYIVKTALPGDGGTCASPPIGGQAQGVGGCWNRVAYRWSPDGKSAQAVPFGVFPVPGSEDVDSGSGVGDAAYVGYQIPTQTDCEFCHGGRKDGVLGFEALDLTGPGWAYDLPGVAGTNGWDKLKAAGLVTSTPTTLASPTGNTNPNGDNHQLDASKFQVPGNTIENAAITYLHANCGMTCHNTNGKSTTSQFLRLEWDPLKQSFGPMSNTPVWKSAINQQAGFHPFDPDTGVPRTDGPFYRLLVGDPTGARSMIYYRPGHRNAYQKDSMGREILIGADEQMPKVDSHRVDTGGRQRILDWLGYMSPDAGYPSPPPPDARPGD